MKENLFEYTKSVKSESSELLDLIKFNISEKVYYYGDHFKKSSPLSKMLFYFKFFITFLYTRFINFKLRNQNQDMFHGLSSTYHNFDKEINKRGISTLRMPHLLKKESKTFGGLSFFYQTMIIQKSFIYEDYKYLKSDSEAVK